jgi:hypothetical protein
MSGAYTRFGSHALLEPASIGAAPMVCEQHHTTETTPDSNAIDCSDRLTPGKSRNRKLGKSTLLGLWVVMKEATAPSQPNVLAQTSQDKTDYRFPLAIAEGTSYKDLALNSGQPVVLKEGENFDVTLPRHDAAGKVIGAIGLTFTPLLGERDRDAARRASAMAHEIEKQISSTVQLFERRSQS